VSAEGLLCCREPSASVKLNLDAREGWAWCLAFLLLAWLEIPCCTVLFSWPSLCSNGQQTAGVGLMAALPCSVELDLLHKLLHSCFPVTHPSSPFSSLTVAYEQESGQ